MRLFASCQVCRSLLVCGLFFALNTIAVGQEGGDLDDVIAAAREKVRQQNKAAYARLDAPDAQGSREKLALKHITAANKLLTDPVKRHALLDEALDLALQDKSVLVAMAIAEGRYPIGSARARAYKIAVLSKLTEQDLGDDRRDWIDDHLNEAISDAVSSNEFADAEKLAQLSVKLAAKAPAKVAARWKEVAESKLEQVGELAQIYADYRAAKEKVESDPSDADARRTVGCYLSFVGGDWIEGRKLLAQGDDDLARLAAQEENPPKDGKELLKMGDGWMAEAAKAPKAYRSSLLGRASICYRNAEQLVSQTERKHINEQYANISNGATGVLGRPVPANRRGAPRVDRPKIALAADIKPPVANDAPQKTAVPANTEPPPKKPAPKEPPAKQPQDTPSKEPPKDPPKSPPMPPGPSTTKAPTAPPAKTPPPTTTKSPPPTTTKAPPPTTTKAPPPATTKTPPPAAPSKTPSTGTAPPMTTPPKEPSPPRTAPPATALAKLSIISAEYRAGKTAVNLTPRVQKAAKDGLLVVFVEPILGGKKFLGGLVVDVQTGSGVETQKFNHREYVFLDGRPQKSIPAKGLVILDAFYGTGIWGEGQMVDVKERVASKVSGDKISISVRDCLSGIPDPIFGESKALILRYALDGEIKVTMFEEHEEIELGQKEDKPAAE